MIRSSGFDQLRSPPPRKPFAGNANSATPVFYDDYEDYDDDKENIPQQGARVGARNVPRNAQDVPRNARNVPRNARNMPRNAQNMPRAARVSPRAARDETRMQDGRGSRGSRGSRVSPRKRDPPVRQRAASAPIPRPAEIKLSSLKDHTVELKLLGAKGVEHQNMEDSNHWEVRAEKLRRHKSILMRGMKNSSVSSVCFETHLQSNLFRYHGRPHPNAWIFHPDVNAHTYMHSNSNTEDPYGPFAGHKSDYKNANMAFSAPTTQPMNEMTANHSILGVPLEISSVDEDFDFDVFRDVCNMTPLLAQPYQVIACKACDIPGIDTSKRSCKILLSEHVSDLRLSDLDVEKVRKDSLRDLAGQLFYVTHLLHSHGITHGNYSADTVFVNIIDYNLSQRLDEVFQFLCFNTPVLDKNLGTPMMNSFYTDEMQCMAMCNLERGATVVGGYGGLQLVVGGYNYLHRSSRRECRIASDVSDIVIMLIKKFGRDFLYFLSQPEARGQWIGIPVLPFLERQKLFDVVDEFLHMVRLNQRGPRNFEDDIEAMKKRNAWLGVFINPLQAILRFNGSSYSRLIVTEKPEGSYAASNDHQTSSKATASHESKIKVKHGLRPPSSTHTNFPETGFFVSDIFSITINMETESPSELGSRFCDLLKVENDTQQRKEITLVSPIIGCLYSFCVGKCKTLSSITSRTDDLHKAVQEMIKAIIGRQTNQYENFLSDTYREVCVEAKKLGIDMFDDHHSIFATSRKYKTRDKKLYGMTFASAIRNSFKIPGGWYTNDMFEGWGADVTTDFRGLIDTLQAKGTTGISQKTGGVSKLDIGYNMRNISTFPRQFEYN
jgi:hypothetical protein